MGRRESDSSPIISEEKLCPARMPLSIRIVDPEFPQSRAALGHDKIGPRPCISTCPSLSTLTPAPKSRMQAKVLAQSRPVEKFSSLVKPSATAPNIA
jgi:hypothetical protein